jgi:hypothetical protein
MLSVIGHLTLYVCKHDSQRSYIRPPKGEAKCTPPRLSLVYDWGSNYP